MIRLESRFVALSLALVATILLPQLAPARPHAPAHAFHYAGGTELLPQGCRGKLEVTSTALHFKCAEGSMSVPYAQITLMEYRKKLSEKVRHMKLDWKVVPAGAGRHNRLFTVLFDDGHGGVHAMVLKTTPDTMQPYLAEIELKAGRRVNVERSDDF